MLCTYVNILNFRTLITFVSNKMSSKNMRMYDGEFMLTTNNREYFCSYFNEQFYKLHPIINIFKKKID